LAWLQHDGAFARTALESSVRHFRTAADVIGTAEALCDLGVVIYQDDPETSRRCLAESAALFRQAEDPHNLARSLRTESSAAEFSGDHVAARRFAEEALPLFRAAGDTWWVAETLHSAGIHALALADLPTARRYLGEAIALFGSVGATNNLAQSHAMLGRIALAERAQDEAIRHFEQSVTLARGEGYRGITALPLLMLGMIYVRRGEHQRAAAYLDESLRVYREIEDVGGVATCLEALGGVAVGRRDAPRAARLFGAAATLVECHHVETEPQTRSMRERTLAAVRATLGEDAFAPAYTEGRTLSLDDAVALALERSAGGAPPPAAQRRAEPHGLTPRERQVLGLLATGQSNRAIAAALVVSERTVEHHVAGIYRKLGAHSRVEAAAYALRHGLTESV
jgi:non-specific serine/threonine protein kinase